VISGLRRLAIWDSEYAMATSPRAWSARLRQTSVRRWISRNVFQRPDCLAALWTLEAPFDRPHVDVLWLGACEFQEMNDGHTVTAPVGYPKYMAEELGRRGVGLGFQHMFVWHLEDWPTRHTLLKRRSRLQDGTAPDLVVLQVGGWSAMKHFLGFHRRVVGMRENFSRALGPLMWPIHWIQGWLIRFFGRGLPEQELDQLEEFLALLRTLWPGARVAIAEPWRSGYKGAFDERRLERTSARLHSAAERLGCAWVPAPNFGPGRRLRCSNAYNVNAAGSRLAGIHYASWIVENGCVRPSSDSKVGEAVA
jgi:hypothetical protein